MITDTLGDTCFPPICSPRRTCFAVAIELGPRGRAVAAGSMVRHMDAMTPEILPGLEKPESLLLRANTGFVDRCTRASGYFAGRWTGDLDIA